MVQEVTQLIGGIPQKETLANVATDKIVGDAITVISIILKEIPVNVVTDKRIGDV